MNVMRWPDTLGVNGRLEESEEACRIGQASIRCSVGCSKTLHISLFFDGTNNNFEYDNASSNPTHSNVARLHRIGDYRPEQGVFKFYIPGVGTPFPEVGENVFSSSGKAFALGFGVRVVWGYAQILNALHRSLTGETLLSDEDAYALCSAIDRRIKIAAALPLVAKGGHGPLRRSIGQSLEQFFASLRINSLGKLQTYHQILNVLQSKHRKPGGQANRAIDKVYIHVFGFSRGAACARVFVNMLINAWGTEGQLAGNIPYEVNFLGLFDTVASVGAPDSVRASLDMQNFDGHWFWTNGGALNVPWEVKHCVHYVSMHEQRMSFPLDSIRVKDRYAGSFPYWKEVAYPGVHSDVGGGYPAGDQGKARKGQGSKLSQIPLHDMYIDALRAGVPLLAARSVEGRAEWKSDFAITPELVEAFNAWLSEVKEKPLQGVEQALQIGMAQSLAWRSLRSDPSRAHLYVSNQKFYRESKEDQLRPFAYEKIQGEKNRLEKQLVAIEGVKGQLNKVIAQVYEQRSADLTSEIKALNDQIQDVESWPPRPGEGFTDMMTNDKTDLLEAAEEFRLLQVYLRPGKNSRERWDVSWSKSPKTAFAGVNAYALSTFRRGVNGRIRLVGSDSVWMPRYRNTSLEGVSAAAKPWEWADAVVTKGSQLTSVAMGYQPFLDFVLQPEDEMLVFLQEHTSDKAVEALPKSVIRLMDDYVHDSRAWFRVPYFHEYAPGGFGWPRLCFQGGDDRVVRMGLAPASAQAVKKRRNDEDADLQHYARSRADELSPPPDLHWNEILESMDTSRQ